ncbi:MAG: hypothetical protein RLZ12_329 [Bacillota bacterium]
MNYSVKIDKKWQKRWEEQSLYKFNKDRIAKKLYCLPMFSYPSADKLHIGHWFNYGLMDVWSRLKWMQGYEVFQPMGFDAFGLPAENYAIKTGIHPRLSTMQNIDFMRKQLKAMGLICDWDYELSTCSKEYYRFTQLLFLKLYEAGLAYQKEAPVNWCPSCQTVLANEQVTEGSCERCQSTVTKKNLRQWFFKTTAYQAELVDCLKELDWPNETKRIQTHWIGRSEGVYVKFSVPKLQQELTVFTTRVDTLYGVTFLAMAPEHPLVAQLALPEYQEQVKQYVEAAKEQSERERMAGALGDKTGIFTGSYAEHPLTKEQLPIYITNYVLLGYGTGIVMGVPGHDQRDALFAKQYKLPIKKVVGENGEQEREVLINSAEFNGLQPKEAKQHIAQELAQRQLGGPGTEYRLRDWLVSRQRYWGTPIPIIYCPACGAVPVPEDELPVVLPDDVSFTPDGESPLKKCQTFMSVNCPKCNASATREADTLDTFVDSAWYFLRYPDNKNNSEPFDQKLINEMLPVDMYVGGREHAAMHFLYARFITKALRDLGYLNFGEPFRSLIHQGVILGTDGQKMSKSKGNTVSPDQYVEKYGADVFRMALMFGFAFREGGAWDEGFVRSITRFVGRMEQLFCELPGQTSSETIVNQKLDALRHRVIQKVTQMIERFQFNNAIAQLMELCTALGNYKAAGANFNKPFYRELLADFVRLLAPLAPHLAEELWSTLEHENSVFKEQWPNYDPKKLELSEIEWALQINGVVRQKLLLDSSIANKEDVEQVVLASEKVKPYLAGKQVLKVIVVPKKLVNIVLK